MTMTIDEKRLQEIEARCEAAPEGPYEQHPRQPWELQTADGRQFTITGAGTWWIADESRIDGLVQMIKHARTDAPALTAEVRRLRGVLEEIAEGAVDDPQSDTALELMRMAREALEGDSE